MTSEISETRECPSCGGTMTGLKCDWDLCGLDIAALNEPVTTLVHQHLTAADRAALPLFIAAGRANHWISGAYDPPFNERSFVKCRTQAMLWEKFKHGNWCNGTAFLYGDLCFIEQGNGNDEWLTVKLFREPEPHVVAFESISWYHIITRTPDKFEPLLARLVAASEEQCRNLTY